MTRALLEQARAALVKGMMAAGGETGCDHHLEICFCEEQAAIDAITNHLAKPQGKPAWHPAPTVPGTWILSLDSGMEVQENITQHEIDIEATWPGGCWYGPIPQETAP